MREIPVIIPYFTNDEKEMLNRVLDSGWVAQGPMVAEFEKVIATHEGVRNGIATTSCTTALHLSMVASGMKPGMDVFAPSFTFVATTNTIVQTGAVPVLVDIDMDDYNINANRIREIIDQNYINKNDTLCNKDNGNILWGIVAVHQFGLCADMDTINEIAEKYNIKVLEDAACAVGAKIGNTHEGGFGNTSCLSFHPRKSITTGEGGMVLTDDDELAARMRTMRSHGASVSADKRHAGKGFLLPEFNDVGYNYRMTDLQAALGLAQAKKLDWMLEERRRRATFYDKLILERLPFLIPPKVPEGFYHTYQSYVCMVNTAVLGFSGVEEGGKFRNELLDRLEKDGVSTRQGTHAVHMLGYYKNRFGYKPEDLPCAYACDHLSITLPLYVQMSDSDQEYVVEMIEKMRHELRS